MAAILHLGNINFAKGEEIDSSVIKDDKSRFHLDMTAELLRYIVFLFIYLFIIFFFVSLDILLIIFIFLLNFL